MKVFLSWSGELSRNIAKEFSLFLGVVIQAAKPWMSDKDIPSGSQWFGEIMSALSECSMGVLFVTQENKSKPWLLFEAGAIARGMEASKVCTVLVDCTNTDIEPPLAQFQHGTLERESVFHLLSTINNGLDESQRLPQAVLERSMNAHWDGFQSRISEIRALAPQFGERRRDDSELLAEILATVRSLDQRAREMGEEGIPGNWAALLSSLAVRNKSMHGLRIGAKAPKIGDVWASTMSPGTDPSWGIERMKDRYSSADDEKD